MMKAIAFAFALALASSVQAAPIAPIQKPDNVITQVAFGCGQVGHESEGGAWRERTSDRRAGAHDGTVAFALGGSETPLVADERTGGNQCARPALRLALS